MRLNASLKPKKRSPFRIRLGKMYYTWKRYLHWYTGGNRYARMRSQDMLPFVVFRHETPLYRKLKDVDMRLQRGKVANLSLAIGRLNGLLIQPGERFSYWRQIGRPSKRKGYQKGMVLFYGTFKEGIGGGLCQLSNLIYWMTLHTPLTIHERYRHSYDVFPDSSRTQPFGSGATCAYNYLDLQIDNRVSSVYQLHLYLTDTHLVGEWRCSQKPFYHFEVYEKEHRITAESWGGYVRHNRIHRYVYNLAGEILDDEYVTENHALMMYSPLLQNREGQ
ncbi:VanW family protein [Marinicrinis lubricantis]|uniref:VanW family protein n=1 Tax=Marinicrinis lubricantis TaxID=2086470 RepID=A0ABW1ILA1_9BACL